MNTYEKQADDFLKSTGTEFSVKFLRNGKHFADDKENRDVYSVTLKRGNRSYTFDFGQSLNDSGFYYTKGKQKIDIDRKHLDVKSLASMIKSKDWDFLNNGKSDVIHRPKEPTAYSVLACITKYDPGTFENFCSEFGYDEDSRKAEGIYKAVCNEYMNVCALFNDSEIDQLAEIN